MTTLISFDIDGTLTFGDPPGIITMDMVRLVRALGYHIGSCSDRPVREQQRLWATQNLQVDFTVLKHRLADVKAQFQAVTYYHIGDTNIDEYYALQAGFQFLPATAQTCQPWGAALFQPR
ncbi:MAG: hypothetical protein AB7N91_18555 [Candidatus Tectimicrobiota bacterium]